jgi:uracil-DNA glycosylase family 4
MKQTLETFHSHLIQCQKCPRLVTHRQHVEIKTQPRIWRGTDYWSKPVPGFGDTNAEILIVGLAPGLHGANRTGRPFTGDGAGIFLYRAIFEMGWSNRKDVESRKDGLKLKHVYISNIVKCAPPGNVPLKEEKENCQPYLKFEIQNLRNLKVLIALGSIAHQEILRILKKDGIIQKLSDYRFQHGAIHQIPNWHLHIIDCYHPSTYNVNTGVLTFDMMMDVFKKAEKFL